MLQKYRLEMETIAYQSDKIFKELVFAYQDAAPVMDKEWAAKEQGETQNRLASIINHGFGFGCKMALADIQPSILFFNSDPNHILVRDQREEINMSRFVERYLAAYKPGGPRPGYVDINKARVSGIFSEMAFTICMPEKFVRNKYPGLNLTPEEWAAMTLHEVGHAFTYCEYFARTVTTNQALSTLSKQLEGNENIDQRVIYIQAAAKSMRINVNAAALATSKNSVVEVALVAETVELSRSELGVSIYDDTAAEFLADQFAVRCGAGRHLITAQYKLDKIFGSTSTYQSTPVFLLKQMLSLLAHIVPWTGVIAVPISLWYIAIGGSISGNVYDDTEARFRRIRNDTVNQLKNRYISPLEKKRVLEDLDVIDSIVAKTKDRRDWQTVVASIIPTYRKFRNTTQLQKQLEQLGNSTLFARAAELTTL